MPKWKPTSSQNRAQEPSKTLLEPGCRPKPFSEASWGVFGSPRNPKNHAPATMRAQFWLKSLIAPGAPKSSPKGSQNRGQKPPWRLQDGFKTRLKKGFDVGSHFKALFDDFGGPRGGGRSVKMASKIASKTALALNLGLSTPGSPPGAHFDPLGPRFWSLRELIFEASAASSAAWPEARSPPSAWLTNGGRRCWRSHGQYNYGFYSY